MINNKRGQKETKRKWHIDYIDMPVDSVASIKKLQKRILNEGGFTREMDKILYGRIYSTYNAVLIDLYKWTIRPLIEKREEITFKPFPKVKRPIPKPSKNIESYPGKNFIMTKGYVKLGKYCMKTNYAYDLPDGMMKQVQGTYAIYKSIDGTFYFKEGDFASLRKEIERLCHIYIGNKLKLWEKEKLTYISSYIRNKVHIYMNQILTPDLNRYDEKTDSYPLIVDNRQISEFGRHLPYTHYPDFINQIKEIPAEYRISYMKKYPSWRLLNTISKQFETGVMNLIKTEFSYTTADRELDEMTGRQLGIPIILESVESCWSEYARYIRIPATDTSIMLKLTAKRHPGKLFKFSAEGLRLIDSTINSLSFKDNERLHNLLNLKNKLVKGEYVKYETTNWYSERDFYNYNMELLYDIKDERYERCHPKCWHLFHSGTPERCNHILHFKDPNILSSQDSHTSVHCYMICMERHIRLFELDSSKSTYAFTIQKEMMEPAIFLLWSYFSSYLLNKRQDKELQIEELFNAFGIKYWFREDPISKFDDGDYFFDQETNSLI